jgi:hypothetical protein
MSKRTDNKNSISSSVFGIKRLLRDFQSDIPALSKKAKTSTANNGKLSNKQTNNRLITFLQELHAFGPVNIDKARIEFKQQIDCIRSICSQFETEVLGDVMKQGAGADFAFRKHFNQLKVKSTVPLCKGIIHLTSFIGTSIDGNDSASP